MFLSESARKGLNMADEGLGLLFNPVTSILIYMSLSIDILGLIYHHSTALITWQYFFPK